MTDKPTPTDAELEALLLDKLPASKHYIRPVIEKMVAAMQAAIDKWGQPAQAVDCVLGDANCKWSNDELTAIYNDANGITVKNPPITTERVFAAMRRVAQIAQLEKQT